MTRAGLLRITRDRGASDLHLSAGVPPAIRIDGDLHRLPLPDLSTEDTRTLACGALNDVQRRAFESGDGHRVGLSESAAPGREGPAIEKGRENGGMRKEDRRAQGCAAGCRQARHAPAARLRAASR